jgi:chlorite dismutase
VAERQLNLYATYTYNDEFWHLNPEERKSFRAHVAADAEEVGEATHFYSTFPSRSDCEFLIWSAWGADETNSGSDAFQAYSRKVERWRQFLRPVHTFWGYTNPSMYSRGKSEQDMDPFEGTRATYLAVYPFAKTKEWYVKSMDARQGMMNEHIKLGKQYFDIKQLLLYSFGLQDHEFVVSYEMEDLPRFSDLVKQLRSTEARLFTLTDTPLITGFHLDKESFVNG